MASAQQRHAPSAAGGRRRRNHLAAMLASLTAGMLACSSGPGASGTVSSGCDPGGQPKKAARYAGPALVLPTASSNAARTVPLWTQDLARHARSVATTPEAWHAGERVWAAIPRGERGLEVAVFRMVGSYDDVVSLLDRRGQRIDGVPPALVHRAGRIGRLRVGDIVLCDALTAAGEIARVVDLEGAIHVVHRWGDGTQELAVDHAETAREGVLPMAYVSYPLDSAGSDARARGLVVALAGEWIWLRDGAGEVKRAARADVRPLPIPRLPFSDDQRLAAFGWPNGARDGRVISQSEDGLWLVLAHDDGSEANYFFTQLSPSVASTAAPPAP